MGPAIGLWSCFLINTKLNNFVCFSEKQAIAKGEYIPAGGKLSSDLKKKKTLRRIQEWERFEANCRMLR